jgi:hypothetical protein
MSQPASARAIDTTPPAPPTWVVPQGATRLTNDAGASVVRLRWTVAEPNLQIGIQRRRPSWPWFPLTSWIDGTASFDDATARHDQAYQYRLRAMDSTGNRSEFSPQRGVE